MPRLQSPANSTPTKKFWNIRNAVGSIPTVELFGDIGYSNQPNPYYCDEGGAGTFQEFANALKAIGPVPNLRVEICSNGGDVVVGKAIHDKLREHPANKVAVIYGICASAATYAALACDTIQIPANSFFMIHEATGGCYGTACDMEKYVAALRVIDGTIANLYAARTGKTVDEICALMEAETWMSGTQAVEMGFADECLDPVTPAPKDRASPANFRASAINSMPDAARVWFDSQTLKTAKIAKPNNAMRRPSHPLFNAANETPIAGGSPAAPAPAVVPAVVPPAVVPPAAAPVPAAPANTAAPAAPAISSDMATVIANAVSAGIAAGLTQVQAQVAELQNKITHGITNTALGGAAPVPNAVPALNGEPEKKPIDYANTSAAQLISEGCKDAFKKAGIADDGK